MLSKGICKSHYDYHNFAPFQFQIPNLEILQPCSTLMFRSSRQCGIHCPIHCNLDRRRSKHPRQRGASPRKNFENQLNKLLGSLGSVLLDNKASENWPGKHFDINLQFNQVQQKSSLAEVKKQHTALSQGFEI